MDVTAVTLPRHCISTVHAHLRSVGREGNEGMALWVGVQQDQHFAVTETVIPAQRHIRTGDGVCVMVPAEELHRLNVWLYNSGLKLLAQIHSHPGRAYHSTTDDAYAVATTVGCLSLVVPNFAREPFDFARVAAYRLDGKANWNALPSAALSRMITITS
ncbi:MULTISPECIES: Mov34/MPN/PAD-1 family protein [unclassified Mesorhizobium]|uniref:Mov34/MPN/PAD-1 family protein n=1 Tax=unclassified Mesorhizobium TaxID=325217 RepID=UPI001FD13BDD|nr:Mov34/MPN/PAD-1 family protein [Mesorhizobium sp. 131-3-5]